LPTRGKFFTICHCVSENVTHCLAIALTYMKHTWIDFHIFGGNITEKASFFSPHLTTVSALPRKTGNPEFAVFHLNAACCFERKHTRNTLKYHCSQLNHPSPTKWSTVCTSRTLEGESHPALCYPYARLLPSMSLRRPLCQKRKFFFISLEWKSVDSIQKSGWDKLYSAPHIIINNHQFWAPRQNGGGDRPGKVQFSELPKLRDLDVVLGSDRGHTGAHIRSRSTHTPN